MTENGELGDEFETMLRAERARHEDEERRLFLAHYHHSLDLWKSEMRFGPVEGKDRLFNVCLSLGNAAASILSGKLDTDEQIRKLAELFSLISYALEYAVPFAELGTYGENEVRSQLKKVRQVIAGLAPAAREQLQKHAKRHVAATMRNHKLDEKRTELLKEFYSMLT